MILYVLCAVDYEDFEVLGVYTTLALAKAESRGNRIHELILDATAKISGYGGKYERVTAKRWINSETLEDA